MKGQITKTQVSYSLSPIYRERVTYNDAGYARYDNVMVESERQITTTVTTINYNGTVRLYGPQGNI